MTTDLTLDAVREFLMRTATPMLLSDEDLRYREANPALAGSSGDRGRNCSR